MCIHNCVSKMNTNSIAPILYIYGSCCFKCQYIYYQTLTWEETTFFWLNVYQSGIKAVAEINTGPPTGLLGCPKLEGCEEKAKYECACMEWWLSLSSLNNWPCELGGIGFYFYICKHLTFFCLFSQFIDAWNWNTQLGSFIILSICNDLWNVDGVIIFIRQTRICVIYYSNKVCVKVFVFSPWYHSYIQTKSNLNTHLLKFVSNL